MKIRMIVIGLFLAVSMVFAQEANTADEPVLFSFEQMFYAYFNKTKKTPSADETELYIAAVFPEEYEQYWRRNDEFGKRRVSQQADQKMKAGIAAFDPRVLYGVASKVDLGEYDFKKEGFPLDGYNDSVEVGPYRFDVLLVFSNNDNFNFFKINPDAADAFLKSRLNWTGSANRDIVMIIHFKVGELNKTFNDLVKRRQYFARPFLHGVIEKVEVYDKYNEIVVGELTKK